MNYFYIHVIVRELVTCALVILLEENNSLMLNVGQTQRDLPVLRLSIFESGFNGWMRKFRLRHNSRQSLITEGMKHANHAMLRESP